MEAEADAIVPVPGFPAAERDAPGTLRPGSWEGVTAPLAGFAAAVFLAWQERARAVSRRFSVPSEPGRDILGTLRLWKSAADTRQASRN